MDTETRIKALAAFLECDIDDLNESRYDYQIIECGSKEYLVVDDDEADIKAKEYIADSLWAFNASFLASETELPEECFAALSEKCESGNDAIRSIVDKTCGLADFADSAVSADGRGHFLSPYDGDENEQSVEDEAGNNVTAFIYRIN